MPLGTARSLAGVRPHSPCGQSPQSGHALQQIGEKVPVRAGRRAFGSPPAPDLVRRAPPPGTMVGAPCGSGLAVPAGLVGWSESGNQAKGGDAWWAAGGRAGPGRSASSPDRGSTRAAAAPAGRNPTTPVHAPHKPATGAAGRAASTAGRSTATATCSTWSTAPGRWWRSWTGCGGSGGRASAALRGQGCGHGVDGWQAPPRGAARLAPRGDGSTARASRPHAGGDGWPPTRSGRCSGCSPTPTVGPANSPRYGPARRGALRCLGAGR
jgi:hypothetical protein